MAEVGRHLFLKELRGALEVWHIGTKTYHSPCRENIDGSPSIEIPARPNSDCCPSGLIEHL